MSTAGLGTALWLAMDHGVAQSAEVSVPASVGLIRKGDQIIVPERSPIRSQINVQAATVRATPRFLMVPASVEADPARTASILPPVTGKVVELKVRLGDHVKKGQELAVLASGDFAQAASDLDKARDVLQLSKRAIERARQVLDAGGGASKDVEQAESNYTQANEEFRRAEARIKAIGGSATGGSQMLVLNSPMSGDVTALSAAPGTYANDPSAPLMTVANLDSIWFTANVPENSLAFVAKGQTVAVTLPAYPGEIFTGTVSFVSAVLDPDTRSSKVRIAFDNRDGRFKPNMFASANFTIPEAAQISVPGSALLMNNDHTTIFVEVAPWTFERRSVEIGFDEGERVHIVQGLTPGQRIIVKGAVLLND